MLACAEGQGRLEPGPVAARPGMGPSLPGPDELLVVAQAAIIHEEPGIAMRAAETVRADPRSGGDSAGGGAAGRAAHRRRRADAAAGLLEEAAASGVTDIVASAQADLGALLTLSGGEPDRARALLQSAIDAGDAQVTAQAQLSLGLLLMNQGAWAEARPLLEAAMTVGVDMAGAPFPGLNQLGALPPRLPAQGD